MTPPGPPPFCIISTPKIDLTPQKKIFSAGSKRWRFTTDVSTPPTPGAILPENPKIRPPYFGPRGL